MASSEWIPAKASDPRAIDDFRKDCLRELKKLKVAWPDLNYATGQGVLGLWPSKSAVLPRAASACGVAFEGL